MRVGNNQQLQAPLPWAFPYFTAFLQSLHLHSHLSSLAVTQGTKSVCAVTIHFGRLSSGSGCCSLFVLRVYYLSHTKLAAWVRKDDLQIFLQMVADLFLMEVWGFLSGYLTLMKHCTPSWGSGFLLSEFNAYSCEIKCSELKSGCLIQWEIHVCYLLLSQGLFCVLCTDTVVPGCVCNSFSHIHSHIPGKIWKYYICHVGLFPLKYEFCFRSPFRY